MSYNYTLGGEDGQQGPPPQQGQPIFMIGNPGMQQGPPLDPLMEKNLDARMAHEYHKVRLRNGHADARAKEMNIILTGMREVKEAIQLVTVAEGDKGSGERPPLDRAISDVTRIKLEMAYLRLAERTCNYVDAMFTHLELKVTDEIKKKE